MLGRVPFRPESSSHTGPMLAGLLAACSASQAPPAPPEPAATPPSMQATVEPSSGADIAAAPAIVDNQPSVQPTSITITALSRGRGVPTATRDMFRQLRQQLETEHTEAITHLSVERIGLEGEMRLCVQFRQRDQVNAALARLNQQAGEVELLEISATPCPSSRKSPP